MAQWGAQSGDAFAKGQRNPVGGVREGYRQVKS
jgi:hypothetical protein